MTVGLGSHRSHRVTVWGTGNMGSAAIRSSLAFPGLKLVGVITSSPDKVGRDAAAFAGLRDATGITATADVDAALASCDAVAYMASGDIRPDEAANDIERCLRAGVHVVTPSLYALYDPSSAPTELRERFTAAAEHGGVSMFASGVDPGWANDALAIVAAGLCTRIRSIRCQEIFDYSTYDQPFAVRELCGFGQPMDQLPMMLMPSVASMAWGGNIRLLGRALGLDIDSVTETFERRPLVESVDNVMGHFEKGTQGAFWLKIIGKSAGRQRIVVEHITRIDARCAPDWPQPHQGAGDHRVLVDGDPELTVIVRAHLPGGTVADGANTTAVNRLLGAIDWLTAQKPGVHDGSEVPLQTSLPAEIAAQRWRAE
jgi:2,4-diaminopentanoate dehydrogenase